MVICHNRIKQKQIYIEVKKKDIMSGYSIVESGSN